MLTEDVIISFIRKVDSDCNIIISNPSAGNTDFEISVDSEFVSNVISALSEIGTISKFTDDSDSDGLCYTFILDYTNGTVFIEI